MKNETIQLFIIYFNFDKILHIGGELTINSQNNFNINNNKETTTTTKIELNLNK
jgi:hypothetical protein